jgi:hypothetical protein
LMTTEIGPLAAAIDNLSDERGRANSIENCCPSRGARRKGDLTRSRKKEAGPNRPRPHRSLWRFSFKPTLRSHPRCGCGTRA